MRFYFFPQILVTIGWKAFKGRIDDTVFGNKVEKRESQKNKTHYICLYKYERNDHNMLIILSSYFYFTFYYFFYIFLKLYNHHLLGVNLK